jgi:hypothetical protein
LATNAALMHGDNAGCTLSFFCLDLYRIYRSVREGSGELNRIPSEMVAVSSTNSNR